MDQHKKNHKKQQHKNNELSSKPETHAETQGEAPLDSTICSLKVCKLKSLSRWELAYSYYPGWSLFSSWKNRTLTKTEITIRMLCTFFSCQKTCLLTYKDTIYCNENKFAKFGRSNGPQTPSTISTAKLEANTNTENIW